MSSKAPSDDAQQWGFFWVSNEKEKVYPPLRDIPLSSANAVENSRIPVLSTDSTERKNTPIYSGVLNYFPLAIAAIARVSKAGNDKHNPGEPLGWARSKSTDHADCIARHLIDHETLTDGEYRDAAEMAWRALARLQELEEWRLGLPPSRGSR
jgi:hypothetical protein